MSSKEAKKQKLFVQQTILWQCCVHLVYLFYLIFDLINLSSDSDSTSISPMYMKLDVFLLEWCHFYSIHAADVMWEFWMQFRTNKRKKRICTQRKYITPIDIHLTQQSYGFIGRFWQKFVFTMKIWTFFIIIIIII